MKATGIVREIDDLGRIVIPSEIRKNLDLNRKDPMEIYLDGDMILLKKHMPCCIFCGEANDVILFKGKLVCKDCVREMNK